MTITVKTIKGIDINRGGGMAKGLYNMSRDDKLSLWFDEKTLNNLLELNEDEFEQEFLKMQYENRGN